MLCKCYICISYHFGITYLKRVFACLDDSNLSHLFLQANKNLSQLPNHAFSAALTYFFLERNGQENACKANDMLQKALKMFPLVSKLYWRKENSVCKGEMQSPQYILVSLFTIGPFFHMTVFLSVFLNSHRVTAVFFVLIQYLYSVDGGLGS